MSINKFGLSENISKSGVSKEYIDSIFIILTKRLEEKVDKNITYPLNMGDNKISSTFVPNTPDTLINKLYLDKHLNKIDENFEKKLDRTKGEMFSDLDMGGYKIIGLSNAITEEDVCNKRYTDDLVNKLAKHTESEIKYLINIVIENIMVKNSSGYIPVLNSNLDSKYGFKVQTSSQHPTTNNHKDAYNVFNFKNSEWITDGVNRDFWIQIELPEPVEIYKFALRGKSSGTDCIYKWKMQGSYNVYANNWETLYSVENEPVNKVMKYYYVQRNKGYRTYRIFVHEAEGENPGLSYWQLFKLDSVVLS